MDGKLVDKRIKCDVSGDLSIKKEVAINLLKRKKLTIKKGVNAMTIEDFQKLTRDFIENDGEEEYIEEKKRKAKK